MATKKSKSSKSTKKTTSKKMLKKTANSVKKALKKGKKGGISVMPVATGAVVGAAVGAVAGTVLGNNNIKDTALHAVSGLRNVAQDVLDTVEKESPKVTSASEKAAEVAKTIKKRK